MISLGAALKRKSIQQVDPTMPKSNSNHQPSTRGRTLYKQLKSPFQQLQQFHKHQLYTIGNLSTEKSLSNIHSQEPFTMKQSRFDDDHHNTESIAQLLDSKMQSNLPTIRTKLPESHKNSIIDSQNKKGSQRGSLESESIVQKEDKADKQEQEEQNDGDGRQRQDYDDYVLGEKVMVDDENEKEDKVARKYTIDHSLNLNRYIPQSESELRMERQIIENQRRMILQKHEDRQIIAIMQQYQNNKQQILNQSRKKHQTSKMLTMSQRMGKMQKSTSLPALRPKKEIIILEQQNEEISDIPLKNKNLLSKGFQKPREDTIRLKNTLSYGKLGFGRKKMRTICQQEILQQQMTSLQQIKTKLRSQGIHFDATKLKKGLINMKNQPEYTQIVAYPNKILPSNPIYKKFPL